jgi:GT2 family glycosyltransferase
MINYLSLIICTYERASSLQKLLVSVKKQSLYPNEIIVIDGSLGNMTKLMLEELNVSNLKYFRVDDNNRGLTKQRNFGIGQLNKSCEIVSFLDDDTILDSQYFENLIATYKHKPNAMAVGGYITNEVKWEKYDNHQLEYWFIYDRWVRKEPLRFRVRRFLKLLPNTPPGIVPSASNGRSVSFLPPSGKIYPTELIMGGVSSFRKNVFNQIKFSSYFEGYGLYEDADFSIRVARLGECYINTRAKLEHHHDPLGRPNYFNYGKMVVRNGWYVWRVKNFRPSYKDRISWNSTIVILMLLRLLNVFGTQKKSAFLEFFGRLFGWFSLLLNKPKLEN